MGVVFLGRLKEFLDTDQSCTSDSDVFRKVRSFRDMINSVEETLKTSREALNMLHLRLNMWKNEMNRRLNKKVKIWKREFEAENSPDMARNSY